MNAKLVFNNRGMDYRESQGEENDFTKHARSSGQILICTQVSHQNFNFRYLDYPYNAWKSSKFLERKKWVLAMLQEARVMLARKGHICNLRPRLPAHWSATDVMPMQSGICKGRCQTSNDPSEYTTNLLEYTEITIAFASGQANLQ